MKRNLINCSLITKQSKRKLKPAFKVIPKLKIREVKKKVQLKVVDTKKYLANRQDKRKRKHQRSKSATVETKLHSVPDVKLKITSTIQDCLDRTRQKRPASIVKFREVEIQFGDVIERIKNLKFSAPE